MSRFPKIASLSFGITVMALSMAGPALAQDNSPTAQPTAQQAAKPASTEREAQLGTLIKKPVDLQKVVVYVGAIHGRGDSQWTDDDASAPALPMVHEQASGAR